MDNVSPLERFPIRENLAGNINTLIFSGPFIDT